MEEPRFQVVDTRRWFLSWFLPPAGLFVVGLVALLLAGHVLGPLAPVTVVRAMLASKRDFFEDEQVKRLLTRHGYQVRITPVGSFELGETADLDSYQFVFPSGQAAADRVYERRRGKHAVGYRPFFTPLVLGTFRDYAEALVTAKVARAQPSGDRPPLYYSVEMDKLMALVAANRRWQDYNPNLSANRLLVQSPDPCRSYSGAAYVGLVAYARYAQPAATEAEAVEQARGIKPMLDAEGQHSEDMAPSYFVPEGRSFATVATIYEHQYLAYQNRRLDHGLGLDSDRVLLYPSAQHQTAPDLISFSPEGDAVGALLMSDPDLRRRAVELGFHVYSAHTAQFDFAGYLAQRRIPEPATSTAGTETWLPKNAQFRRMIDEIGDCRW
ncbi:hypothetical protein [Amycolatopsis sp.]|uniref:hypothetical protein n=1 Tax=Amycolatopsis sp. TaxID=37632 RepID=UPI002D7FE798|nr:hypothetical protein [Amycolatopsis sp.]HET6708465.1 hypothetical protein [Amycolatopsis sp.]